MAEDHRAESSSITYFALLLPRFDSQPWPCKVVWSDGLYETPKNLSAY